MIETTTNLWLVDDKSLHKLDIVTGEIIEILQIKEQPKKLVGNEVHLFYESDKSVYYYNKYSKHHEYLKGD